MVHHHRSTRSLYATRSETACNTFILGTDHIRLQVSKANLLLIISSSSFRVTYKGRICEILFSELCVPYLHICYIQHTRWQVIHIVCKGHFDVTMPVIRSISCHKLPFLEISDSKSSGPLCNWGFAILLNNYCLQLGVRKR